MPHTTKTPIIMGTVTEITITIGSDQHESDEYMRDTYCKELEAAVAVAFPCAVVEVEFSTSSPVFKVWADWDEAVVTEQVKAIHEKLWQSPK